MMNHLLTNQAFSLVITLACGALVYIQLPNGHFMLGLSCLLTFFDAMRLVCVEMDESGNPN